MSEGIRSVATNMLALWQRHEVLANNLANSATAGFKRDDVMRGAAGQVQWTDFSQGPIQETGRALDVALNGPGFFVVEAPEGSRYTRAAALSVSRQGYLVTPDGLRILGSRGPIAIGSGDVNVTADGEVREAGRALDTLRVVDFPKPYRLVKEGNGLFAPAGAGADPQPVREPQIAPAALERSNVSAVETMVGMIETLRLYESAQKAIQAMDEAERQAANEIGRV